MSGNSFLPMFTNDNIREVKIGDSKVYVLCMSYRARKLFEGKVKKAQSSQSLSALASMIPDSGIEDRFEYLESELMRLSICDPQGKLLVKDDIDALESWMDTLPFEFGQKIISEIMDLNKLNPSDETYESAYNDLTDEEKELFNDWILDKMAKDAKKDTKKK